MSNSGRFREDDPDCVQECWDGVKPSDENYRIWIGIPQVFNPFKFMASVDHEIDHLQHPSKPHAEMAEIEELMALWEEMVSERLDLGCPCCWVVGGERSQTFAPQSGSWSPQAPEASG